MSQQERAKENGKARKNTGKRFVDTFKGFVDLALDDAAREVLQQMTMPGETDTGVAIGELVAEGYKVSVSGDPEHNCVIATATGKQQGCPNQGYALSARGPDTYQALCVLWYKVAVIAHWGPWTNDDGTGQNQEPVWR